MPLTINGETVPDDLLEQEFEGIKAHYERMGAMSCCSRDEEFRGYARENVIARVLINHPRVLLMDEPFGALDALTRSRMQELLLELWARMRTTIVFVTHDIDEALFLADRVLILSPRPGRIVEELRVGFERPRHAGLLTHPDFVALKRRCLSLLRHEDGDASTLERLSPLGPPPTAPQWRFAT